MDVFLRFASLFVIATCHSIADREDEHTWSEERGKMGAKGDTRMVHTIPLLTVPSTATVVLSACDSNPCTDGKVCSDIIDGYKCVCPKGKMCDSNIDGNILLEGKPSKPQTPSDADIILNSFKPSAPQTPVVVNDEQPSGLPSSTEFEREGDNVATAVLDNEENADNLTSDTGEYEYGDKTLSTTEINNGDNDIVPINVISGVTTLTPGDLVNGGNDIEPSIPINGDNGRIETDEQNNDDYEDYSPTVGESDSINQIDSPLGKPESINEIPAPTPPTDDDLNHAEPTVKPSYKYKKPALVLLVKVPRFETTSTPETTLSRPTAMRTPTQKTSHPGIIMVSHSCNPNPCRNNGTCVAFSGMNPYSCRCADGYSGMHCSVVVITRKVLRLKAVTVLPTPPTQEATQQPALPVPLLPFQVVPPISDAHVCSSNPCQQGGTCIIDVFRNRNDGSFHCLCRPGFTGKVCGCKAEQEGTCNDAENIAPSPPVGHPCSNNPCKQGGTCVVDVFRNRNDGTFTCVCRPGFTGNTCQCTARQEAPCIEEESKDAFPLKGVYTSSPSPTEQTDVSYPTPATPGVPDTTEARPTISSAECKKGNDEDETNGCEPTFVYMIKKNATEGSNGTALNGGEGSPSIELSACTPNPCQNGGTCHAFNNGEHQYYSCICPVGFEGAHCQEASQNAPNITMLQLKAAPTESSSESYHPTSAGYDQPTEPMVSTARQPPLLVMMSKTITNTSKPADEGDENSTLLAESFESSNPCTPNPCQNGGTCHAFENGEHHYYSCTCPAGFEGTHCQGRVNITFYSMRPTAIEPTQMVTMPPATSPSKIAGPLTWPTGAPNGPNAPIVPSVSNAPNPCIQGSSSSEEDDETNGCKPSFVVMMTPKPTSRSAKLKHGESKERPNPCLPNPCQNGGTCHAFYNGDYHYYSCICPVGFEGTHCQEDICSECHIFAICPKGKCKCKFGYDGDGYDCVNATTKLGEARDFTDFSIPPTTEAPSTAKSNKVIATPTNASSTVTKKKKKKCLVDVAFVIDVSANMWKHYQDVKKLLMALSKRYGISNNGTHAAIVTFGNKVEVVAKLDEGVNQTEFNEYLDGDVSAKNGNSRLDRALTEVRESVFAAENGGRRSAKRVVVVVTDGEETRHNGSDNADVGSILRHEGVAVTLIVVGSVTSPRLYKISGKQNLYLAPNVTYLGSKEFLDSIRIEKCSRKAPSLPKCNVVADIGFILDSSGSVWKDYDKEKDFLKTLATAFGMSPNGSHAGVVTFSSGAEYSVKLKDHTDLIEFCEAVDNIRHMGGSTRIDLALKEVKKNMFTKGNGGRPGVRKLVILLTDGVQTGQVTKDPSDLVSELQDDGITVVVVGVGNMDKSKLTRLAGKENFYLASNFTVLNSDEFVGNLTGDTCNKITSASKTPQCKKALDIAFVLDSSASVRLKYSKEKKFLKSFAKSLGAGNKYGSHAGVVTFSSRAELSIKLKDHKDLAGFNKAVDAIPHMNGRTKIDRALKLVNRKMFLRKNGGRKDAEKLVVLITDGEQTGRGDPELASKHMRDAGVHLLVIGIGKLNPRKLRKIAGKGNWFLASNFSTLTSKAFVSNITRVACTKINGKGNNGVPQTNLGGTNGGDETNTTVTDNTTKANGKGGNGRPDLTIYNINLGPKYVFNGLELHQSPGDGALFGLCPQYGGRVVYEVEQITADELISLVEPLSSKSGSKGGASSTLNSCANTNECDSPPSVPTMVTTAPVNEARGQDTRYATSEGQNYSTTNIGLPLLLRRAEPVSSSVQLVNQGLPPLTPNANVATYTPQRYLYNTQQSNPGAPVVNYAAPFISPNTPKVSAEVLPHKRSRIKGRAVPEEEDADFFNFDEWKALSGLSEDIGCSMFLNDLVQFGVIQNSDQFRKAGEHVSLFCPVDSVYKKVKSTMHGREKSILMNHVAARQDKCGSLYKSLYPGGKIIVSPSTGKRDKVSWKANGVDILVSLVDEEGNEIVILKDVIMPVTRDVLEVLESRNDTSAFYEMWRKSDIEDIFTVTEIKKVCFINDVCLPLTPSLQKTLHDAVKLKEFTIIAPTNSILKSMGTRTLHSVMRTSKTITKFLQDFVFLGSLESPSILHKETAYSLSPQHDMLTLGMKGNMVTLTDDNNQEFKVKRTVRVTEGILHIVEKIA